MKNSEFAIDTKTHAYDSISAKYDQTRFNTLRGKLFNLLRKRILRKVRKSFPSEGIALDVACGTGLASRWLSTNGYSVAAGDLSLGMLRVAYQKLACSKYLMGLSQLDACNLPFKDKSFDIITSFRFLNLISPEVRRAIHKEVARVGKSIYLFTYALDSPYQRWRGRMKVKLGFSEACDSYPATLDYIKEELNAAHIDYIRDFKVCNLLTSEIVILASMKK